MYLALWSCFHNGWREPKYGDSGAGCKHKDSMLCVTCVRLLAFTKAKIVVEREEIKANTMRQLMAILKKVFADCFEKWKEHWDKFVRSKRE